jgi:hypothetical protein
MKFGTRWFSIPTTLAIALAATQVLAQMLTISPGSSTIQVSGTSGGPKREGGCAGNIAASPNHRLQVAEDSNIRFSLQGSGQPSLLIQGNGQDFCVPADSFSGGKIEIPGRLSKGTYAIYVGDRAGSSHPYTLSISAN